MELWRRIYRVHKEHPEWCSAEIAKELGVCSASVRAICRRRGWKLPDGRGWNRKIGVTVAELKQHAIGDETPEQTLQRLLMREAA